MEKYVFSNDEWRVWGILKASVFALTKEEVAKELAMSVETAEKTLRLLMKADFVRESDGKFTLAH